MENVNFRILLLNKLRTLVDCSCEVIHSEDLDGIQLDALKQSLTSMYQSVLSLESSSESESAFELRSKIENWEVQIPIMSSPFDNENAQDEESPLLDIIFPEEVNENSEDEEIISNIVSPPMPEVETSVVDAKSSSVGFGQLSFEVLTKEEVVASEEKGPLDIFSSLQSKYQGQNSVHSKLYGEKEEESTLYKKPIDLKSAIGINEKFLFINELFKGNMKECNDMILSINDAENIDMAVQITDGFKIRYAWDETSIAYSTLRDFLRRRFPN